MKLKSDIEYIRRQTDEQVLMQVRVSRVLRAEADRHRRRRKHKWVQIIRAALERYCDECNKMEKL